MKSSPWIFSIVCIITIAGHITIGQYNRIQQLELGSELSDKARAIDQDQIRDLLYTVQQLHAEKESIGTQAYVSGVISVLDNKEHYERIWHDGYDRGAEVQLATNLAERNEQERIKDDLNLNQIEEKK